MKYNLSNICVYAKGKIDVAVLDNSTYISTENMIPNKGGITKASSLPTVVQTQTFITGDVLVSNIRPYFKKIWFAEFGGGCSNDVLVFRAKDGVSKRFLYYILADDKFFGYSMATSKGTKMPRGDKVAIMKYPVPKFTYEKQEKIAGILEALDKKIKLNTEINDNLEEQAQLIFQSWFIDYEPFGGITPSDWQNTTLGNIASLKTESWSPSKNPDTVVEHYSIPAFDEKHYPVFEIASGIKSNKYILTPESVMISKLNPDTKRIWRPMCLSAHPVCSTEFIIYEAKKEGQRDFIYSILDSVPFSNHLCSHTTGSTNSRQRAMPKTTLDFPVLLPPDEVISDFCHIVTPMYDLIASNTIESQSLAKTRDSLLPRLMSGELDVSNFNF
ncbi:restriction endonuclease subunit S [Caproicibacterium argilliputei]|uniref:Restriction endonuclease subunit S n=1 Tax=Caproicibacterium argilliputei TaxID=3030016 RepID=A0AA97DAJ3_9FIRM|nr:restriction endonuclease subunit S [Caproicibacterium argilliputei]WOC31851.1 restriction endonuclease subunit S [Caproicibacterium argilliputei]